MKGEEEKHVPIVWRKRTREKRNRGWIRGEDDGCAGSIRGTSRKLKENKGKKIYWMMKYQYMKKKYMAKR